jgi:hypothetical protein
MQPDKFVFAKNIAGLFKEGDMPHEIWYIVQSHTGLLFVFCWRYVDLKFSLEQLDNFAFAKKKCQIIWCEID